MSNTLHLFISTAILLVLLQVVLNIFCNNDFRNAILKFLQVKKLSNEAEELDSIRAELVEDRQATDVAFMISKKSVEA